MATKRYRSNVFGPKIKRPKTFELTKRGHALLRATTRRCESSVGDLVEYFLVRYSAEVTKERMAAAAR